jgi:hypothetical protein
MTAVAKINVGDVYITIYKLYVTGRTNKVLRIRVAFRAHTQMTGEMIYIGFSCEVSHPKFFLLSRSSREIPERNNISILPFHIRTKMLGIINNLTEDIYERSSIGPVMMISD